MKRLVSLLLFLSAAITAARAETLLAKGTVGSRKVTLWLSDEAGCGPGQYDAMYRYDGMSNWLVLTVEQDDKGHFCLLEAHFTGVLLLRRTGALFTGQWISPDGGQHLPVKLQAAPVRVEESDRLREQYNKVQYEADDC